MLKFKRTLIKTRKPRIFELLRQMKPVSLWGLAFAVFLIFGTIGIIIILGRSEITPMTWKDVIVFAIAFGGISASIVLFPRLRTWAVFLMLFFISPFFMVVTGVGSFAITSRIASDSGIVRWSLGLSGDNFPPNEPMTIKPDELIAIHNQKVILAILAILTLTFGYTMFVRVIRDEVKQRSRLETEMKIVQDIQQSLLPQSNLETSWYSISGITIPATEVGGDYFDVVQLSDDQIAVTIADVTGHGVGAGILSAMTKSAFRSQLEHDASPVNVLINLNKIIFDLSEEKMFVTFAYLVADRSQNIVRLATAGHPPILCNRKKLNQIEELRTVNLGLGIKRDVQFTDAQIQFEPSDVFLLYTDGVVEAADSAGEQFGSERLIQTLLSANGTPQEVCTDVIAQLRNFTKLEVFQDDVSLVCIKFS